jgi:hypothetical protein
MSTEILSQTVGAGGKATFGAGSVFVLGSIAGPVSVVARKLGSSNKNRTFANVPAGFKFTADSPDDGFDLLEVTSPSAQTISIAVGTDDVEFSNAVTVTGNVSTQDLPASTLADTAPKACGNGAQTAVVPVNGARRRVLLTVDPAATGNVFFRAAGGANNVVIGQPGMSYSFNGTYGIDCRNDTGAAVNIYIAEES